MIIKSDDRLPSLYDRTPNWLDMWKNESAPIVSDLMTRTVIHSVRPSATIREAAERMKEVQAGCLVVIDRGKLVGILTERDIVQRVVAQGKSFHKTPVLEIMSKPVITASPSALVSRAAKLMLKHRIRRLPVKKGKKVVGMLTTTDYAKYLCDEKVTNPLLAAAARADYQTIFE